MARGAGASAACPGGAVAPWRHGAGCCLARVAPGGLASDREAHAEMLITVADLRVFLALEQRRAEAATELAHAEAAVAEAEGRVCGGGPLG